MCDPLTVNEPLLPLTTPVVVAVPSPQLIVAVNPLARIDVLLSANVATVPENDWPAAGLIVSEFGVSTSAGGGVVPPLPAFWVASTACTRDHLGQCRIAVLGAPAYA